jgi:hypothetical protein
MQLVGTLLFYRTTSCGAPKINPVNEPVLVGEDGPSTANTNNVLEPYEPK